MPIGITVSSAAMTGPREKLERRAYVAAIAEVERAEKIGNDSTNEAGDDGDGKTVGNGDASGEAYVAAIAEVELAEKVGNDYTNEAGDDVNSKTAGNGDAGGEACVAAIGKVDRGEKIGNDGTDEAGDFGFGWIFVVERTFVHFPIPKAASETPGGVVRSEPWGSAEDRQHPHRWHLPYSGHDPSRSKP